MCAWAQIFPACTGNCAHSIFHHSECSTMPSVLCCSGEMSAWFSLLVIVVVGDCHCWHLLPLVFVTSDVEHCWWLWLLAIVTAGVYCHWCLSLLTSNPALLLVQKTQNCDWRSRCVMERCWIHSAWSTTWRSATTSFIWGTASTRHWCGGEHCRHWFFSHPQLPFSLSPPSPSHFYSVPTLTGGVGLGGGREIDWWMGGGGERDTRRAKEWGRDGGGWGRKERKGLELKERNLCSAVTTWGAGCWCGCCSYMSGHLYFLQEMLREDLFLMLCAGRTWSCSWSVSTTKTGNRTPTGPPPSPSVSMPLRSTLNGERTSRLTNLSTWRMCAQGGVTPSRSPSPLAAV